MKKLMTGLSFVFGALVMTSANAGQVYTGVGLTLRQDQTNFVVIDKVANGPADKAGIRIGDVLVRIDGRELAGFTLDQVTSFLRGPQGTSVVLSLLSAGTRDTHDVTVIRDVVSAPCFMEGAVNLRASGTPQFGNIYGWIGQDSVNWNVNNYQVSGPFKGEMLNFNLQIQMNNAVVSGWVHGAWLSWMGYQGAWNLYQNCVP